MAYLPRTHAYLSARATEAGLQIGVGAGAVAGGLVFMVILAFFLSHRSEGARREAIIRASGRRVGRDGVWRRRDADEAVDANGAIVGEELPKYERGENGIELPSYRLSLSSVEEGRSEGRSEARSEQGGETAAVVEQRSEGGDGDVARMEHGTEVHDERAAAAAFAVEMARPERAVIR